LITQIAQKRSVLHEVPQTRLAANSNPPQLTAENTEYISTEAKYLQTSSTICTSTDIAADKNGVKMEHIEQK